MLYDARKLRLFAKVHVVAVLNNGVRVLKALLHLTPLYSHNDMNELFCEFLYVILCWAIN